MLITMAVCMTVNIIMSLEWNRKEKRISVNLQIMRRSRGRFIPVQFAIVVRQDMEAAVVEICHIKLAVEGSAGVICRIEKELFGNYENDFWKNMEEK